jgi:hypothetical protein
MSFDDYPASLHFQEQYYIKWTAWWTEPQPCRPRKIDLLSHITFYTWRPGDYLYTWCPGENTRRALESILTRGVLETIHTRGVLETIQKRGVLEKIRTTRGVLKTIHTRGVLETIRSFIPRQMMTYRPKGKRSLGRSLKLWRETVTGHWGLIRVSKKNTLMEEYKWRGYTLI